MQQRSDLITILVKTDLALRYQGSILGYIWSFVKPVLLFIVYFIIFGNILNVGNEIPNYPLQLFLGVICWNFFTEATNAGLFCLVSKSGIITKIFVPRSLVVFSSCASTFVNFSFQFLMFLLIFVITAFFHPVVFHPENLLLMLLGIGGIFAYALGFSYFLSITYVFFRDLAPMWELVLTLMLFTSPILFIVPIQHYLELYYFLNPLATLLPLIRSVFFDISFPENFLILGSLSFLSIGLICVIGYFLFKALERRALDFI